MKIIKIKSIIFILIVIFFIGISSTVYGKYIFEQTKIVANINIDRNPPQIELISIKNTNNGYENYANKTHTITTRVKVIEKNIKTNNFNKESIQVLLEEEEIDKKEIEIKQIEKVNDYIIYDIILTNIEGNGILKIKMPSSIIIDTSNNINEEIVIDTKIKIDNISPNTIFEEKEVEEGKVEANIISNEAIRSINGWKVSENNMILTKEFSNNLSYKIEITDLAQNKSQVEINITKATSIILEYASFNQTVGWSFGNDNNGIAGKEAILKDSKLKTEMLAFHTSGNIDDDFIQVQTYVHTYWGEGCKAIGMSYENIYNHGYNPDDDTYSTMSNGDKIYLNKNVHVLFGGDGMNLANRKDITKKEAIPEELAEKYLFGISGLKIKLKDYSEYSIIYQIFIDEYGWQETVSDGQEALYSYDKPMTAYRIVLVPKTEKQYIIDEWNKDIGTNNIN